MSWTGKPRQNVSRYKSGHSMSDPRVFRVRSLLCFPCYLKTCVVASVLLTNGMLKIHRWGGGGEGDLQKYLEIFGNVNKFSEIAKRKVRNLWEIFRI